MNVRINYNDVDPILLLGKKLFSIEIFDAFLIPPRTQRIVNAVLFRYYHFLYYDAILNFEIILTEVQQTKKKLVL